MNRTTTLVERSVQSTTETYRDDDARNILLAREPYHQSGARLTSSHLRSRSAMPSLARCFRLGSGPEVLGVPEVAVAGLAGGGLLVRSPPNPCLG